MKWKKINKNHKFKDGSIVTQRHQVHLYDCYELTYTDDNNQVRTLVASKDHILHVNISTWPLEAQNEVRQCCIGRIPLKEDITIEILGTVSPVQKQQIADFIAGENDGSCFNSVEEISQPNVECYIIDVGDTFKKEVFVKRTIIEDESQKIDEDNWWIPIEGLFYLFSKYGELEI